VSTPRIHLPTRDDGFLANVELEWVDRDERRDDGGDAIHGTGVMFRLGGAALAWDDRRFEEAGARLFAVAGISFRPDTVAGIGIGSRLRVEPEPSNPHDPNAVAVYAAGGGGQLGYVPRTLTATVRRLASADAQGVVHFVWRRADGTACGLRALLAPAAFVARVERFAAPRRRVD
jgi:hypothetical protein